MRKLLISLLLSISVLTGHAQQPAGDYPITPSTIRDVVLTDHFWLPKIKLIQDVTIPYAFNKCEQEGRMDNFLVAGGKKAGKYRGEMPFDDTDLYKIIEGASYSLISKPNPALDAYLDSIIGIIKTGQEPDGYLTTWFTIDRMNPPQRWVEPSEHRWVNEIANHELYNSGHLFEAAAAHYWATGKRNLLDIAIKNADLLVKSFGPGKLSIPPGHEIVETGLVKLYHITHTPKYLELAKFYLDIRGDSTTHELFIRWGREQFQDFMPVTRQSEVVGHAVRALYLYAGMTDIAAIYHNPAYLQAVNTLWENMVTQKMYITGGLGSLASGERFGNNYELPNRTCYCETCAAIASVLWNQRMFLLTGDPKYCDIIERTLYNGVLSGLSLDGKNFFYVNPLESNGQPVAENKYSAATRQPWYDASCCPTNLTRFVPSVPGLIYANEGTNLYVNLYMSNHARVLVAGNNVEIAQQTNYPWDGRVEITLNTGMAAVFTLKLRLPGWAQGKPVPGDLYSYADKTSGKVVLKVNGKVVPTALKNGYLEINRKWNKGDKVELTLPMEVHRVVAHQNVAEDRGKVAFERGPIVYCAEQADNNDKLLTLFVPENTSLKTAEKTILTDKVTTLNAAIPGGNLTLIPYYIWANRGEGVMKVWFPITNYK